MAVCEMSILPFSVIALCLLCWIPLPLPQAFWGFMSIYSVLVFLQSLHVYSFLCFFSCPFGFHHRSDSANQSSSLSCVTLSSSLSGRITERLIAGRVFLFFRPILLLSLLALRRLFPTKKGQTSPAPFFLLSVKRFAILPSCFPFPLFAGCWN